MPTEICRTRMGTQTNVIKGGEAAPVATKFVTAIAAIYNPNNSIGV